MRLPEQYRHRFKGPMGEIIADDAVSRDLMTKLTSGCMVVTVGDRTTERMLEYGIIPDMQIVDGMEQREKRAPPDGAAHTISCKNPPAHITDEAVSAIMAAYAADNPTRILVSGEEDLLLIPALEHAPDGAVLIYGQPQEGLVVVKASENTRTRARQLMAILEE